MSRLIPGIGKSYKVIIIIIDLLIVHISYIFAFLLRYGGTIPEFNFVPYIKALPLITIAAVIYFDFFGMLLFYRKTIYDEVKTVTSAVFLLSVTTVTITYFLQGFSFPRTILIITPVLQILLLSTWKSLLLKFRLNIVSPKIVMFVGNRENTEALLKKVKQTMMPEKSNIKYVFDISQSDAIFKRLNNADEIFLSSDIPSDLRKEIITHCMGGRQVIYFIPRLFEISLLNSKLTNFDDIPAFMIDRLDLTDEQKIFKRIFDLLFSSVCLILGLPFMLIIGLLIKLTSYGPALYSQERVTRGNRIFKIYKFRTMVADAESDTGPVLSEKNDQRVTKVGRVLRKTRIDELPQLINVLKGEMSIVGPRPERPQYVEKFCEDIPEYNHRYVVKAGITGYAQILGNYDTTPEDKLRYDLMYIKNYSLLLDIKLILQTVRVIISKEKGSEANIKISKKNLYNLGYTNKGQSLRL